MKKLLVILLSLGLLVAFGATASAADVKFGGSYYVVGVYDNNQTFGDLDHTNSRAFFYTRTRIQPVFQIAEGLTFTTRFDALEKQWGQTDWRGGFDDKNSSRREGASGPYTAAYNPKIQESIEFERAYVTFRTAVGQFDAGIQSSGKWGTDFGDDEQSRPRVKFTTVLGPLTLLAVYEKEFEADTSGKTGYFGKVDADNDTYVAAAIYSWKGGNTGLLYKYFDRAATRLPSAGAYTGKFHALIPYVKATFGPVYVEGEAFFAFGKYAEFDSGVGDKDIRGLGAYIKARVNLGPAYFGGSALYSQGDDDPTDNVVKMGPQSQDLDVGLILGNDALQTWNASNGNGGANGSTPFDSGKANSLMFSGFGGFDATPKLNVEAVLVYAKVDKAPANYVSKDLGWEVDLTAKYKIYDNLTYMVGAGYLWAGDYFKGTSSANSVGNDYLLMNRLSLSF